MFFCNINWESRKKKTSIDIVDGWSKQTTHLVVSFVASEVVASFF
jgi:hypothetical protein